MGRSIERSYLDVERFSPISFVTEEPFEEGNNEFLSTTGLLVPNVPHHRRALLFARVRVDAVVGRSRYAEKTVQSD